MAVSSLSGEGLLLLLAFSTTLAEDSVSVFSTTEYVVCTLLTQELILMHLAD